MIRRRLRKPLEAEEATRDEPWRVEAAGFRPGSTTEEEPAAATGAAAPQCGGCTSTPAL